MASPAVRRDVTRDSRGRAAWVVPLLLCVAILLVAGLVFNLAYLDTGGEQLPAAPTSGSPSPSATGIFDSQSASEIAFLVLGALGITSFVIIILRRRGGPRVRHILRPSTWMDVVAMLIAFFVFALFLGLWPRIASSAKPLGTPGGPNPNATGNGTFVPSVSGIPLGVFLAASLVVSVLVIALFFRMGSGLLGKAPAGVARPPRHAAVQAVQAAIEQLQLGGDVRQAILACYGRFCGLLGAKGIGAQDVLTPRELEDLAVRRLGVSVDSSEALTSLFEEARYSVHTLGDADRDRAVQSLERIRADLEA